MFAYNIVWHSMLPYDNIQHCVTPYVYIWCSKYCIIRYAAAKYRIILYILVYDTWWYRLCPQTPETRNRETIYNETQGYTSVALSNRLIFFLYYNCNIGSIETNRDTNWYRSVLHKLAKRQNTLLNRHTFYPEVLHAISTVWIQTLKASKILIHRLCCLITLYRLRIHCDQGRSRIFYRSIKLIVLLFVTRCVTSKYTRCSTLKQT